MKLRKISFRNIGSFGNKLQTLEFSNEGGLHMVTGRNGSGKTTLVSLPKILYYGKLDNLKKEDIVNRINKHGQIEGEVEVAPDTIVTIKRNIFPSVLTVYKHVDGEKPSEENDIGKSGIKNYQDYIDLEVTSIPYHIFSNVIALSIDDFKSFISMTSYDKRIIIDKLFATDLINVMNDMIKRDMRDIKINMDLYDREIYSLNNSINEAASELKQLKDRVSVGNKKRMEEAVEKLKLAKAKIEEAYEKLKEFQKKEKEIKTARDVFNTQKKGSEIAISNTKAKIELYNQDKCPTCETPFSDKRFDLLKGELNETLRAKEDELMKLVNSSVKYDDILEKTTDAIKKLTDFILNAKASYTSSVADLERLKQNKPEEFTSIENIISKNTETVKIKEDEKEEISTKNRYLSILAEMYSDSGVKKRIIESYLPTLNKEIEYMLNELHFPYMMRFNSEFDAKMTHLGMDINVETLSVGERKRVDLAVLISIIRMIKRKYPMLNIFMLDEVLSSIDNDGIYDIIGLLRKTAKELKMNIFIINHAPLPIEFFSFRTEIQKNDGFSDMVTENLED